MNYKNQVKNRKKASTYSLKFMVKFYFRQMHDVLRLISRRIMMYTVSFNDCNML